jgi:signal transduction histidine kinase
VTAREEERRRLRRDLHDGLGPALAAIAVRSDAARPAVEEDPEVAREALEQIGAEARAALADVRRLVHDLRPPALDELGLARALAGQAQRFAPAVRVEVDAPDLGPLPAAVEVAAYRIVGEALANVVRHSGAATAGVRVRRGTGEDGDVLEVEVVDDGRGLEPDRNAGVGLASMRERAAELGGSCEIAARPEGGTRVRARLPLPAPSPWGTEEEVVPA